MPYFSFSINIKNKKVKFQNYFNIQNPPVVILENEIILPKNIPIHSIEDNIIYFEHVVEIISTEEIAFDSTQDKRYYCANSSENCETNFLTKIYNFFVKKFNLLWR